MFGLLTCAMVLATSACGKDEPAKTETTPGSGSAVVAPPPTTPDAAPKEPEDDGSAEIARMVIKDVGGKALGNQTIDAACVTVTLVPTGDWTIGAGRVAEGCGDKKARSIVWLYKRRGNGKWSEDYVGSPPKCWKGVPPDIAPAVAIATKIKAC